MIPLKRRKKTRGSESPGGPAREVEVKFPQVALFLLERRMGRTRRDFLSGLARKRGLRVEDRLSDDVTHLLSENNSAEDVMAWLRRQGGATDPTRLQLLDISWLTDSVREGVPVPVQERHRLQPCAPLNAPVEPEGGATCPVPAYACQRRTAVDHRNRRLTDALALLAENAELNQDPGRAVAFQRAAAVLKALPTEVTRAAQLRGLPAVGDHSLRVVQEVLETGRSSEVETTRASERFRVMKLLTGIFGVGPKTAHRWFRAGIRDLDQLQASGEVLNQAQRAGLLHYQDLNHPVSRAEADSVAALVQDVVLTLRPGAQVTMTGGFRRGKQTGHDVDFLLTHPEEGQEVGLLDQVLDLLGSKGLLLFHQTSRGSVPEPAARPSSSMDHFERSFCIFRLDRAPVWRAVRVDLVVSPASQFAFALLGWTGSKLFERELRRWASREQGMSLSSHALYCHAQRALLPAATEQDIFSHLALDFVPPTERNA